MTTKHLPGPWMILGTPVSPIPPEMFPVLIGVEDAEGGLPIMAVHNVNGDYGDARLVAAAPDLLEALQYAVEQVPELGSVPGISAAIARATGEQPDPHEISEAIDAAIAMIERLEAAEKSDAESLAMYRKARDERDALRLAVRHEADCVDAAKAEIEALRARIEAMEQQEPVVSVWRCDNGHIHGSCEKTLPMGAKLYALPGAKGE